MLLNIAFDKQQMCSFVWQNLLNVPRRKSINFVFMCAPKVSAGIEQEHDVELSVTC